MRVIDIHEVEADFVRLLNEAAEGHSFIISVEGVPMVMVLPHDSSEDETAGPASSIS